MGGCCSRLCSIRERNRTHLAAAEVRCFGTALLPRLLLSTGISGVVEQVAEAAFDVRRGGRGEERSVSRSTSTDRKMCVELKVSGIAWH